MATSLSIGEFLAFAAPELANHIALLGGRRWLRYCTLRDRIDATTTFLNDAGIADRQVVATQLRDEAQELIVKLALAKLGAGFCVGPPEWVLDRSGPLVPDRIITDVEQDNIEPGLFLRLPEELTGPESADLPLRLNDPDRRFCVSLPDEPQSQQHLVWLSEAMAWERMLAVTADIEPHTRVALCGLQEPARTLLSFGILARGGTIMFLPSARSLPANLARYGIERLHIQHKVALRMVANPRALPMEYAGLRQIHIHAPRPIPGLAARYAAKFGSEVSFSADDPHLGPLTISDVQELGASPLGLRSPLPDIELRLEPTDGDEPAIRHSPARLLARQRLGDWLRTDYCAIEDPARGLLFGGRADRAQSVGPLALDTRILEEVLKADEEVRDAMAFADAREDEGASLTAVIIADSPCADRVLARARNTLGILAPAKVIQMELSGLDSRRGYLRNLLHMLATVGSRVSLPGVVSVSDESE
jgi:hypothetical protein